ncbi:sensor histidine kinase [uncultured Vibrio sp.]|uniref:sensor histidine kinase n=1 Tax=uncultured Vibrio sp. TaxID=114054 RepID=UPI002634B9F0|nr:HAMP domain-containing sensor histidine kinase [uncultured Vibrio sp.]
MFTLTPMDTFVVFTLYLIYGLAFFAIGFSVVFRNYKNSQISISKLLPILAMFGFVHGIHEWSELYLILYQDQFERSQTIELLKTSKLLISYLALGAFGWKMLDLIDWHWVKWGKILIGVLLFTFTLSLVDRFDDQAFTDYINMSNNHVRVLFGLGSGLLAGITMIVYGKQFYDVEHQAASPFVYTGAALIFYGITSGVLSSEYGIWVIFLRSLCALAILHFLWRALRVFDRERELQIEAMVHRSFQDEKLKELGELTSAVAHEVKTPLSSAMMSCDLLEKRLPDDENVSRQLVRIRNGIERAAHISQEVLNYAHHRQVSFDPVAVRELCQSALSLVEYRLSDFDIELDIDSKLQVFGDAVHLEEVLVNILVNAVDASELNKSVSISAYPLGSDVIIELVNRGPTIPDDVIDKVMQPFFTTKPIGKGTGMGLAICRQIMTQHHGELTLHNIENGLMVRLKLPKVTQ